MELGLSTYSFPWAIGVPGYPVNKPMGIPDLLGIAESKDILRVQIGDNLPLHLLSSRQKQEILADARDKGIELEVGTRRLTVENLRLYLDISHQMHSAFLRVVIDDADFQPDEGEVVKTIKNVLPDFKNNGVILAIENHDRFSSISLRRIIEDTDPEWVGICLDTANSLGAGEGINEVTETLAPYTVNLHIKDFTINRISHKMGFEVRGCTAGKGMLNIPNLINKIDAFKKCRTATLETWLDPEPDIESTLKKEEKWVEEGINYLIEIMNDRIIE